MKQSIVIIGTGLAGYLLAKEFRKYDTDAPMTLMTANDGAFYSKPLLSTALTQKKTATDLVLKTADKMAVELKAKIITHTKVTAIHPHDRIILTADHQEMAYDKLILACGSHVHPPTLMGNAITDIKSVNDLNAYAHFREGLNYKKHWVILGSGLVGCEFANDLLNAGYRINILTRDPYPLARLVPEPLGRTLESAFASRGLTWHFHTLATAVDHTHPGYEITTNSGKSLSSEGVFSATGIRANTDLAGSAGLGVNNAIIVDRYLRTNDPHIFALGDCAEIAGDHYPYIEPLLHGTRALAKTLTGEMTPVVYPPMPITIKTSLCPIVTLPPPPHLSGQWEYSGTEENQRALFYDALGRLHGFALTGRHTSEKSSLIQQLSAIKDSFIV